MAKSAACQPAFGGTPRLVRHRERAARLRRDFPTLLSLLLELEMANFRKARPHTVFLHPQMTDLLLAMDNGRALRNAIEKLRGGFGSEVGLATYNLGVLYPKLQAWGLDVAAC